MHILQCRKELTFISNHPVEEASLPQGTAPVEPSVDQSRGVALYGLHDARDVIALLGHEQGMKVIGHDCICQYERVFPADKLEGLNHQGRASRFFEDRPSISRRSYDMVALVFE